MQRVLAATDFSPHAERALAHALELVKLFGAELEVFTSAYVPAQALAAMALGMAPGLVDEARREAVQRVETLAATLRARGVRASSSSSTEEPSSAICARAAELGTDLVALGTRGHTALAHLAFGSIPERVPPTAPPAALVVPGTRGRTGLAHVVLGSTAERVIRRAHVPVVTCKSGARR